MAISRYEQRRIYEEAEVKAIGTEYVRADVLPALDVQESACAPAEVHRSANLVLANARRATTCSSQYRHSLAAGRAVVDCPDTGHFAANGPEHIRLVEPNPSEL
jgi:hypothetical protein